MYKLNYKFLVIVILFIITSSYPYLFFAFPLHPYKFLILLGVIALLAHLSSLKNISLLSSVELVIITGVFSFWFLELIHLQSRTLELIPHIITSILIILTLQEKEIFRYFAEIWFKFNFLFIPLAVISFTMAALSLVDPVVLFYRPGSESQLIYLIGATFSNSIYNIGGIPMPRVAGPFDEPGQFATAISYFYIMTYLLGLGSVFRFFLTFAGFATASLGFIITLPFLFLLGFYTKNSKKSTAVRFTSTSALGAIIVVILLAISFATIDAVQDFASVLLFDRVNNSDALSAGDNRSDSINAGFRAIVDAPLLGVGSDVFEANYGDPASIMGLLGSNGLIGSMPIFLPALYLMWLAVKKKSMFIALTFTIIFINYIHRPPFIGVFFIVTTYIMLKLCYLHTSK